MKPDYETLLALLAPCLLAGCALVAPTATNKDTYLTADTDPSATLCGGTVNGIRVPNVPTSGSKCQLLVNDYIKNGSNSWIACNSAPDLGEACAETFTFKLTGKP